MDSQSRCLWRAEKSWDRVALALPIRLTVRPYLGSVNAYLLLD